jgi:predicted transcriptional regulator of viral defense system
MQPIKTLTKWLQQHTSSENYLFTLHDLRSVCPTISNAAFKTLLSRAVKQGILERVCRGLYAFNSATNSNGLLLFHVAAYTRSNEFNYISLETALSDTGIISQIPSAHVTIMSSGRSNKISCGNYGTIEFIHTSRKPTAIMDKLIYDEPHRLWRASPRLAFEDMKKTHKDCNLINRDLLNESI